MHIHNRGMKGAMILLLVGGILSTIGAGMRFYEHTIAVGRAQVILGKVECVVLYETVICKEAEETTINK